MGFLKYWKFKLNVRLEACLRKILEGVLYYSKFNFGKFFRGQALDPREMAYFCIEESRHFDERANIERISYVVTISGPLVLEDIDTLEITHDVHLEKKHGLGE